MKNYDKSKRVYEEVNEDEYNDFVEWCLDKDIICEEEDAGNLDWEDFELYLKYDLKLDEDKIDTMLGRQKTIVDKVNKLEKQAFCSDCKLDVKTQLASLAFTQNIIFDRLERLSKEFKKSEINRDDISYQIARLQILFESGESKLEEILKKLDI